MCIGGRGSRLLDTSDVITAAVAIYAAALSTWEAVARRRDRRPQVKVDPTVGIPAGAADDLPRLVITAWNEGDRAVTIHGTGLFFPSRIWRRTPWKGPRRGWGVIPWVSPGPDPRLELPHLLEPGRSCTDAMNMRQVTHDLTVHGHSGRVRVRAFFADETRNLYASKPFVIDVEQWRPFWDGGPTARRD